MKMRSYGVARAIYSFLALLCWGQIIIGAMIGAAGLTISGGHAIQGVGMPAMTFGITMAVAFVMVVMGIFGLANVQSGRTNVDVAEYTQQLLKVARDQIEISQQTLTSGPADDPVVPGNGTRLKDAKPSAPGYEGHGWDDAGAASDADRLAVHGNGMERAAERVGNGSGGAARPAALEARYEEEILPSSRARDR